jgi:23S rRNA pseudouridine2605 synthase
MTIRQTRQAQKMSKQRTNSNKRPANSRPTSSKGRSNSSEGGRNAKSSSSKRTSSRGSESDSKKGPKVEKDTYGSKRTTQTKSKKPTTSKRHVGKGPSGRKPLKSNTSRNEETFIPYALRSDDTKSPYVPRGVRASSDEERPASKRPSSKGVTAGAKRSFSKRADGTSESRGRSSEPRSTFDRKPAGPKRDADSKKSGPKRDANAKKTGSRNLATKRPTSLRDSRPTRDSKPEYGDKRKSAAKRPFDAKPRGKKAEDDLIDSDFEPQFNKKKSSLDGDQVRRSRKSYENKLDKLSKTKPNATKVAPSDPFDIRLNKYIANSGICSRREADQLIAEGTVKVNGVVVTELGYKVKPEDSVKYNNKVLKPEKFAYVLLNKPKDFITTMDDENDRKTVMQLVANATNERIYPVGRLDRNTTGLLLFTNDGELAQKLTHPSNKIKKIYEVELDKPITTEDFNKIADNKIHLFDGAVKVDDVAIISPNKKVLGIEIHEGRNRIVRRIFESMGYEVQKLDRVMYAGLTKKNITRGSWRYLTATEVNKIKYLD